MDKRSKSLKNLPKIGDLIGCSDNDFGIVLRVYGKLDKNDGAPMVEIMWNSGRTLADPWDSQRFIDDRALFWIMSKS